MSHSLFDLLARLDAAEIHYHLSRNQPDTVTVTLTLVGERVEVAVFSDGHMEVSRFSGDERVVGGSEVVFELIARNAVA